MLRGIHTGGREANRLLRADGKEPKTSIKVPLVLIISHSMKTCGGVDAKFHAFLVPLSGYERLVLRPCNYPLRKEGTQRAGLRAGVEGVEQTKLSALSGIKHRFSGHPCPTLVNRGKRGTFLYAG
jgi:hypothetical protein